MNKDVFSALSRGHFLFLMGKKHFISQKVLFFLIKELAVIDQEYDKICHKLLNRKTEHLLSYKTVPPWPSIVNSSAFPLQNLILSLRKTGIMKQYIFIILP